MDRRVTVVIVSYNTQALLRECLRALQQSQGVALDVMVVDNASSDGSAAMVRAEFPDVRLLAQTQNLGFAAANNLALLTLGFREQQRGLMTLAPSADAQSTTVPSDAVLLLNPDTAVRSNAIAVLMECLEAHPRAGLMGAQLVYPDGRFQHSAFRFPGLAQIVFDFFPLHPRLLNSRLNGRYARHTQPFQIDHPLGACMLARRETIEQVGLMDEGYFMYVEEVDWCRRIWRAGWEIGCEPRAVVVHHEGQSTRQFRQAMFVALWRSRLRYYRKYHSAAYVALVRALVRVGLWQSARRLPLIERAERMAAFDAVRALTE